MIYTFDTETSYDERECWIWSWAMCDEDLNVETGNGLDVLRVLTRLPHGAEVWIHNLPYDAEYLYWELLRAGYKLVYDLNDRDRHHGVFDMLSDLNGVLSMAIWTRGRRVILRDSNRIFRCKLEKLPKLCGFANEITKGEMDYFETRQRDHVKTQSELDYQVRDVIVLMRAMKWVRGFASAGNTVGAIAVNEFKTSLGRKAPFVGLTLDERRAYASLYSGGVVYCPPEHTGKELHVNGRTYDRNSMYPAEAHKPIPVRINREGRGTVKAYHVLASGLRLRQDGFPLLITPFTGKAREVIPALDKWLFADELDAIRDDYNIDDIKVIGTLTFDVEPVAESFVDKWYKVKSTEPERREYAKYVLNNITGKWGENAIHEQVRRLVLPDGNYQLYRHNEIDETVNNWTFMPAVAYVTSQSRLALRAAARAAGMSNLLYTDTDSIHTLGDLPANMVDKTRLGAWKCENTFTRAMYVKPKSYYEADGDVTTACKHAGINDTATLADYDDNDVLYDTGELISANNIKPGAIYYTNQHKRYKGGFIIERVPKTI